jgi:hypothetical protein
MSQAYYALIGDAVGSRRLPPARRARLQRDLAACLAEVNRRWRRQLAARFAVTMGDEFQGLLAAVGPAWDIVHWMRAELAGADWIMALGRGPITTPLAATAPQVDGPCFHQARSALEAAKPQGVLLAFGEKFDPRLDGLSRYYSALYWGWTRRQRETAALLRIMSPEEAAARLGITRSAVSHLSTRLRWRLVAAGDDAFRRLLTGET